jgi:hypothetical protein
MDSTADFVGSAVMGPDYDTPTSQLSWPQYAGELTGGLASILPPALVARGLRVAGIKNSLRAGHPSLGSNTAGAAANELVSGGAGTTTGAGVANAFNTEALRGVARRDNVGQGLMPGGPVVGDDSLDLIVAGGHHRAQQHRAQQAAMAQRPPTPGRGNTVQPSQVPPQAAPQAPAVHVRNRTGATSTRVREAQDQLRDLGVETPIAQAAVPQRGTQAEEFSRGLTSLAPPGAGLDHFSPEIANLLRRVDTPNPDFAGYPTLRSLFGGDFTDLGRQLNGRSLVGASPKTVVRGPDGQSYLVKGMPGGRSSAQYIAQEAAATRFAHNFNQRTPIAHPIAEGGSVQSIIPDAISFGDYTGSVPNLLQQNPVEARMLGREHIIDSFLANDDVKRAQMMFRPRTNEIIPGDKGHSWLFDPSMWPDIQAGRIYNPEGIGKMSPYLHYRKDAASRVPFDPREGIDLAEQIAHTPTSVLHSLAAPMFKVPGYDAYGLTQQMTQRQVQFPHKVREYYNKFF